jgi:hypothetical protein
MCKLRTRVQAEQATLEVVVTFAAQDEHLHQQLVQLFKDAFASPCESVNLLATAAWSGTARHTPATTCTWCSTHATLALTTCVAGVVQTTKYSSSSSPPCF